MHIISQSTALFPLFVVFLKTVTCLAASGNDIDGVPLESKYEPTWESLDTRPLPEWYQNAKVGIFIHWGVFSVPSFGSEWFWKNWKDNTTEYVEFMEKNYPPGFTYQDFAPQFTAEFFDPDEWAEIFNSSGARYVVLTSKHHEGYTLWPSLYSFSWNAVDVGPKRNLLGDLMKSIRDKTSMKFGLYHSLMEWYNPLYLQDKESAFTEHVFAKNKAMPELYELVNTYLPEVIWSDGDWEAPFPYWNSTEFIAWLYNDSPVRDTVVVNDRWGLNIPCKHGDFYTCTDRYNPGVLIKHKWENCMTLDKYSWGFRRNAQLTDYLTSQELITTLVETISCGGNLLVNVGPTKDGIIAPIFQDRLRDLGTWLNVNAEAIYPAVPWTYQNDSITSGVWYTKSNEAEGNPVFAIVLQWPDNGRLLLGSPQLNPGASINLVGTTANLKWTQQEDGIEVEFPERALVKTDWAWTLKMLQVKN